MFPSADPRLLHGALVHFPIALTVTAAVIGLWRVGWAREAYVFLARAAAASSLVAVGSGLWWGASFGRSAALGDHRDAALLFTTLALTAALLAASPRPALARLLSWLAVGAVVVAAHLGGAFAHPDGPAATAAVTASIGLEEPVAVEDPLPPTGTTVDFERDVSPILERACLECHGPQRARGGLQLATRAQLLRGGRHGPAVMPGDAVDSLLVRRLRAHGKEQMPPKAPLADDEIHMLQRWIDEGAYTRSRTEDSEGFARVDADNRQRATTHWAFQPPQRPPLPARRSAWSDNPIDAFVLADLERDGHVPRDRAAIEVRLRRAVLAVLGRGPDLEELAAARAGMPWNRIVDRLLSSPEYGVAQASRWLDVARFAENYGAGSTSRRSVRPWLMWIIKALDDGMPFDRFVQLQLAADLLEGRTGENVVATGFLQLATLSLEGGTDPEANHHNVLVDKVTTVGSALMGLTTGCAACHDHKYDPISQKDFYQLYSVMNDSKNETETVGTDVLYTGSQLSLPSHTIGSPGPGETSTPVAVFEAFRETRIAKRGDYRAPGARVPPGIPAIFKGFPTSVRPDRAALARWITSIDNPLFARVTVNRLWEARFGRGLVATPEDFGTRAPPPSHPALLDWLATELVRSGYDIKHIERLILTSQTYQQQAGDDDDDDDDGARVVSLDDDPLNIRLGRGPRVRVDGEVVRDAVLAAAGLLSPAPDATHRRSVFLPVLRGAGNPTLAAFDMPDREVTCSARTRSTAPQQSLALLNAPELVTAATELTHRALRQPTTADRAQHLYRILLGRDPTPYETATIARFVEVDDGDDDGASSDDRRWFQVTQALLAQDELVVPL